VAAGLVAASCAAAPAPAYRTPASPTDDPPAGPTEERGQELDAALGWPALTAAPFPSRGHGIALYAVEIRVPAPLADVYRQSSRGSSFPEGFQVVARHTALESGAPGPLYWMRKGTGGAWAFEVLLPDGRVDPAADPALCERCHAEAPNDFVFGLPHSLRSERLAPAEE
jgi:hypothetical protein